MLPAISQFHFRIHDSVPSGGIAEVQALRTRFFTESESRVKVSIDDLGEALTFLELLHPGADLPSTNQYDSDELSSLYSFAETCTPPAKQGMRSSQLEKAWIWHEFMCGVRPALMATFFRTPPYIHPSGASFVYRSWLSGRFTEADWLKANLSFTLPVEWAALPIDVIGETRRVISSLSREARAIFLEGSAPVLQAPWVWIPMGEREDGGAHAKIYRSYPESELRGFLEKTPFEVVALARSDRSACLIKEGNLCWRWNARKNFERARQSSLILAAAALILGLLTLFVLVNLVRKQRREEARKRFALRMLTHELRTPITTLLLQNEKLRAQFDLLPASAQDAALMMSDEIQRLRRLAEVSSRYLREAGASLVEPRAHLIESARSFVNDLLLEHGLNENNFKSADDFSISQDSYWLGLAIRNLLRNAIAHGKPPIEVECRADGPNVFIVIKDAGQFGESKNNEGLGIGLELVRAIATELGGCLNLSRRPTTMTLVVRRL